MNLATDNHAFRRWAGRSVAKKVQERLVAAQASGVIQAYSAEQDVLPIGIGFGQVKERWLLLSMETGRQTLTLSLVRNSARGEFEASLRPVSSCCSARIVPHSHIILSEWRCEACQFERHDPVIPMSFSPEKGVAVDAAVLDSVISESLDPLRSSLLTPDLADLIRAICEIGVFQTPWYRKRGAKS